MPTLHERLIGDPDLESNEKIGIHAFMAALHEWQRGKLTAAEVIILFDLDTGQQSQASVLKGLLNAAPDQTRFILVFKDWLYLGETLMDARYLSALQLNSRLEDEVIDQGGTLP